MKYQDAENLKPKFVSLIGKPTNDSVIKSLLVSYIEVSVANEHFKSLLMGLGHKQVPAYENDYTLWTRLEDDTFQSVRAVVFNDKVEDLYDDARLLD